MSRARPAFTLTEMRNAAKAAAESNVRAEWELMPDGAKRVAFTPVTGATPPRGTISDADIVGRKW